ncbi:zinc finger protein 260 isoform X2 [Bicyclus anynana]|uniref:Zinc finger protein 260 isoform X2 n=1 Tax=Bicyclus anynana TaxID=110368 RepID=A0ABM3LQ92_BICAN|nr:zinc finger protein 260 isoform X2 [Bicyclus anynana]
MKMQCCVPFCKNASDNTSFEGAEITFHELPSDMYFRTAWFCALGLKDYYLTDPAVVCSKHFLDDDFHESKGCVRNIRTNVIPSTVQMCMICLDTDSKLFLMSKYKLEEVYEQLSGLSLCHRGNLKQTLCVLCAQRLINFSKFRDLCLRSHTLMTDLVEKHDIITIQHKELIDNTIKNLKYNFTQTTLDANHCDLYIDHTDEEEQRTAEESVVGDVATVMVKIESMSSFESVNDNYDHIDVSKNDSVSHDDYSELNVKLEVPDEGTSEGLHKKSGSCTAVAENETEIEITIKSENAVFECKSCFEVFVHKNEYNKHMNLHIPKADGNVASSASLVSKACVTASCSWDSPKKKKGRQKMNYDPAPSADSTQCLVAPLSTRLPIDTNNKMKESIEAGATQTSEQIHETSFGDINNQSSQQPKKVVLDENPQVRTITGTKSYSCETCNYKCTKKNLLFKHKRTHTTEKPYSCEICNYKCATKYYLALHKRTHTGEKPYSCDVCNNKFTRNSSLFNHMRIHTGEKPYSCEICNYKSKHKQHLLIHMRTHTGVKPHSCEICNYKCLQKANLIKHMQTHTDERRFSCDICDYKSAFKYNLILHIRTHTGEKPYSCEVCNNKFTQKSSLLKHMKIHTGEKPYSCDICNYKSSDKYTLARHKTIHIE